MMMVNILCLVDKINNINNIKHVSSLLGIVSYILQNGEAMQRNLAKNEDSASSTDQPNNHFLQGNYTQCVLDTT